ncbi:MAG: metallophosphoesterase [Bacteroidetes bacterium]|nr:metallophosphoesterase [Bacteroidota bacterium]
MKSLAVFTIMILSLLNIPAGRGSEEPADSGQNQKPVFSFGIIADVQYADADPAGTRYYRSSITKLREALSSFRKDSVDFVITLGDLIDRDIKSYDPLLKIMDSSGLKFYNVPGNHDYSADMGHKRRLPAEYIKKPGYYSFSYNSFRFIFLNGNEISVYSTNNKAKISDAEALLDTMKKKKELNAVEWNGGLSMKQLAWLDGQLKNAALKKEKAFIICHFPVFPENVHNLLNYKEVLQILEKYHNTVAWLNGHNHAGNYGNTNSTHFVTFRGMVETEKQNSFARVDVYRNKIWITGSGREKSQILAH